MTRSVTIVNTSNWDGEDYLIRTRFKQPDPDKVNDAPWAEITLKPGERTAVFPESMNLEIMPTDSKEPEPFKLNGLQVLPVVVSYIGQLPDKMKLG